MLLPINLETDYPGNPSDPSVSLHQQHHDVIHAAINALLPTVVKTKTAWDSSDLILKTGQVGIVAETGEMRSGDGGQTWAKLPSPYGTSDTGPVNVLAAEFGVDGGTDHTAAIQTALDAAAEAGRNVHFPRRAKSQPYVVGGADIMLRLASGVSISADPGVVIKVKDGNGDFRAILGGTKPGTDLSQLTVSGLTFDQNSAGNPVGNVKSLYVSGSQRFCIYVGAGSGITVRDCRFTNVDSCNVVYIGSPTMKDVRVQDCDFDAIGTSRDAHDHSSIYLSADGLTVTGNRFRGVLGGNGATTAIETHGSSQVVTGNRVESYLIGMNITGVTPIGSAGVVVSQNTVRNARLGVQLWSYAGAKGGLRDVTVTDNTIHLNRDPWIRDAYSFPKGISLAASSTDHVDGLRISGNVVRFEPFASGALRGEYQANGIEVSTSDATRELRNFDISDNIVICALGPGLRLQMRSMRGRVSNNRVVDPASSAEIAMPAFWRSGLTFLNELVDVEVFGNRVHDTRTPHRLTQVFATSITGSLTRSEQWDNTAVCSDGATVPESRQTSGKRFGPRGTVAVAPRFAASLYYGPEGGRSVGRLIDGQVTTVPFWVASTQAWDRIGCEVTLAVARSAVRLGVYADDGSGRPGRLALDAGTVAADVVGAKERTIALSLPAGLYHLAIVAQGGSPYVRVSTNNPLGGAGVSSLAIATGPTPRSGYTKSGVSGSLPTTFVPSGQSPTPGVVVLRAA